MVLAKEEALAKGSILSDSFACASWQKITLVENDSQLTPHESPSGIGVLRQGACVETARVDVFQSRNMWVMVGQVLQSRWLEIAIRVIEAGMQALGHLRGPISPAISASDFIFFLFFT
jgi:hypothetical protein